MRKQFSIKFVIFTFTFLLFTYFILSPNPYTLNPTFAQTPACTTTTPRAEGLVTSPDQSINSKFGTLPGTCIIDPKASFVPFKIPSYDDLKSLYYTQSKATKAIISSLSGVTDQTIYLVNGDLTISSNPSGSGTAVVFVEGNLNITADYTYGSPTTGTVFVVKGNVNISQSVARIDAIIISGGTICSAYDGFSCPGVNATTSQLVINGSLISINDSAPIKFRRTLDPAAAINNTNSPAEKINHQVKYLSLLKDILSSTLQKWSEVEGGPVILTPPPPAPLPPPPPPPPVPPPSSPVAVCGNGIIDSGEQCDDGNTFGGDGCSAACQTEKKVFVTSITYLGNFGGLVQSDNKCKVLADASTILGVAGRTWMAWLSDSTSSPSTRFTTKNNGPYVRIDGVTVANNWTDLTDGSLASPINVNENKVSVSASVWTNTAYSGTSSSSANCSNWLSTSGSSWAGNSSSTTTSWSQAAFSGCLNSFRLYCFEQ